MKYKTTRKSVVENSTNIIAVGYCGAAHLLRGIEPRAYTCGVYGWNFDIYEVHGLTICTGYRGMPGRNAKNLDEYERKAREICEDYYRPYEDRRAEVAELLDRFCAQA